MPRKHKHVSVGIENLPNGRVKRIYMDNRGNVVNEEIVEVQEAVTGQREASSETQEPADTGNAACAWCGKPILDGQEVVWSNGQPRHSDQCQAAYEQGQPDLEPVEKATHRRTQHTAPKTQDTGRRTVSPQGEEAMAEESVMTAQETAAPKKRGKPNPYEDQIQEAIARHAAGNEEPVQISFKSEDAAKKGSRNLYQAFRGRGYKTTISIEGASVTFRVTGAGKKGRKAAKGAKKSPGRPSKAPGRPKAVAPVAKVGSGSAILVRVKAGRGWTYNEFGSKGEASAFLYQLDSSSSPYEVYERKPVTVKKTVEGW